MQELKDRIVKEGKVLPGNIIKVDGFLNHRIDTELMDHIAEEFGKHFNMDEVTMILTAEASGIALSAIVAHHFHKPMIFAKKAKSDNIEGGLYQSDIFSYTYKKKVTLLVSNLPTLVLLAIYWAGRERVRKQSELDKMNIQDL